MDKTKKCIQNYLVTVLIIKINIDSPIKYEQATKNSVRS